MDRVSGRKSLCVRGVSRRAIPGTPAHGRAADGRAEQHTTHTLLLTWISKVMRVVKIKFNLTKRFNCFLASFLAHFERTFANQTETPE